VVDKTSRFLNRQGLSCREKPSPDQNLQEIGFFLIHILRSIKGRSMQCPQIISPKPADHLQARPVCHREEIIAKSIFPSEPPSVSPTLFSPFRASTMKPYIPLPCTMPFRVTGRWPDSFGITKGDGKVAGRFWNRP